MYRARVSKNCADTNAGNLKCKPERPELFSMESGTLALGVGLYGEIRARGLCGGDGGYFPFARLQLP